MRYMLQMFYEISIRCTWICFFGPLKMRETKNTRHMILVVIFSVVSVLLSYG